MSEGQTKRRIGQGMKPRGEQAEPKQEAPIVELAEVIVPTAEGQAESIIEPILARQEGEQSGDSLEPETVQNLDSAETAGVAPSGHGDALAEALLESGIWQVDQTTVVTDLTPAEMDATAEKVADQFIREFTLEEMEALAPKVELEPCPCHDADGKRIWPAIMDMVDKQRIVFTPSNPLGLQPDGSYKIVTTIPEGYWQAVKDWADSDGVTPEEWVDRQLSGYLENWGSPAKGR